MKNAQVNKCPDITACNAMIEKAYHLICTDRTERSHNNSIWDLRIHWSSIKPQLQRQLSAGLYRLSPLQSYTIQDECISSWTAMDAVVLKALSLALQPLFSIEAYPHCTHLKGAGGIHSAIKKVNKNLSRYQHILKLDLVSQYCQRLEIKDGNYTHFQRGIPKGCPLSPLMAALYLKPLDDEMQKHGFYVRFMDDWVIMVKTKHQLRKMIKLTHQILEKLKLKMHPDKTFLGCIKKGFDFLGIHFSDVSKISKTSLENHRVQLARRYAQGASAACIGDYIARWTSWCAGVLKCCSEQFVAINPMGQETTRQLGPMNLPKEDNHEEIYISQWMEKAHCI